MAELIETFQVRSGDLWTAIIEHMQLSFIALLIAVVIAVPLGIYLAERQKHSGTDHSSNRHFSNHPFPSNPWTFNPDRWDWDCPRHYCFVYLCPCFQY